MLLLSTLKFMYIHSICRSDLKTVMIAIFNNILCIKDSQDRSSSHEDIVNIFLNAAKFSMHNEGGTEETMSFEDFRNWCTHLPSVKKLLGSLLLPPGSGIAALNFQLFCYWLIFLQFYLKNDITRSLSRSYEKMDCRLVGLYVSCKLNFPVVYDFPSPKLYNVSPEDGIKEEAVLGSQHPM